jgi:hypothetical protein
MFFILALLAWFIWSYPVTRTSHKRTKLVGITLFIIISFTLILAMTTIFVSCIVESLFLSKRTISDATRGEIACSIDESGSCTLCTDPAHFTNNGNDTNNNDGTILIGDNNNTATIVVPLEEQCPEWSRADVTRILQSQAKAGATLAVICVLYALGSFRHGLMVRKHIVNYKIAYV